MQRRRETQKMERVCAPFLYTLFHRMLLSAMMMFANFVNFANFAMEFLELPFKASVSEGCFFESCIAHR